MPLALIEKCPRHSKDGDSPGKLQHRSLRKTKRTATGEFFPVSQMGIIPRNKMSRFGAEAREILVSDRKIPSQIPLRQGIQHESNRHKIAGVRAGASRCEVEDAQPKLS